MEVQEGCSRLRLSKRLLETKKLLNQRLESPKRLLWEYPSLSIVSQTLGLRKGDGFQITGLPASNMVCMQLEIDLSALAFRGFSACQQTIIQFGSQNAFSGPSSVSKSSNITARADFGFNPERTGPRIMEFNYLLR